MKTFKQFTEDQKFGPNWDDGVNVRFHSGPNKKETHDDDIKKLLKKMVKQRA